MYKSIANTQDIRISVSSKHEYYFLPKADDSIPHESTQLNYFFK